ncbi:toll/interleukin-1 receptor domain-containing protein [Rhodococcus sp. Leaf278]|uniref:toll/interleukin-1 receptor domain-containing protein n=1 Tax=Rhodococcus sp. Leaf278 TaxID=1736319 RepID=UPI002285C3BA|nr:toll/interleukin-1 receptor domain-containing protein [Rhodococcus sp. Leaf278]
MRQQDSPVRDVEVRDPVKPQGSTLGGQTWDVFLSHASEDKASIAVPLRDALTGRGVTVWLDKTELRIGDLPFVARSDARERSLTLNNPAFSSSNSRADF